MNRDSMGLYKHDGNYEMRSIFRLCKQRSVLTLLANCVLIDDGMHETDTQSIESLNA